MPLADVEINEVYHRAEQQSVEDVSQGAGENQD
jgi:hypothetical protein